MAINLLARKREQAAGAPINLLRRNKQQDIHEQPIGSFEDLSSENQNAALDLAKQKIDQQYPGMPNWLRDAILNISPRNQSPTLDAASKGFSDVMNYIPAALGGAMQGASLPIRGIASLIPGQAAQDLANSRDLRELFPKAEGTGQKSVQMASEILGGGGLFGKLMQGVKGASALAHVPEALQNPLALGGAGYLATPGSQTDKGLGAAGALALGAAGNIATKVASKAGDKIGALIRGLKNNSTAEDLVQAIQKPHDIMQSTVDDLYGQVRNAIKNRNIRPKINHEYLDEISTYPSMNSKTHQELIQKAKDGDYEAIHALQSSLYKKGTKDTLNSDSVIETRGENLLQLRDKINENLEQDLLKNGHIDVAHVLNLGKKANAELKNTYFDRLLPKGIGKLVAHELRLVPENPEKLLSQNSVPMDIFRQKHPEAAKHAQGIKEKKQAIKALEKTLIGLGVGGGATAGIKSIYDLLE